jgi:hypothetical protein
MSQYRQVIITPPESAISDTASGMDIIVKKFSLSYPKNLNVDSNTLIYCYSKPLDTSFLIHIVKKSDQINVVYYEILPDYHRSINDFADTKSELLFFEGYSFKIDSVIWDQIKIAAQKLTTIKPTASKAGGCADCGFCSIYYDYNFKLSDRASRPQYDSFTKFLRDSLLYQVINKRKPIRNK